MTDKDIIKALEFESTPMERNCVRATYKEDCLGFYCTKTGRLAENCMECKEHTMDWRGRHSKATLDLINRQQTAFENSLIATREWHRIAELNAKEIINLQAEIERLERHTEMYHELRAEAIKEYMKILEEKLSQNTDISNVGYQSIIFDMEQGYKEMVGEQE